MNTFHWLTRQELQNDTSWWKIYENSFPPSERESQELLYQALEKNIIKIGCYAENNETIGISVIQPMHSLPFALMNYFAISNSHRNRSLGSLLFSQLTIASENFVKEYSQNYLGLFWEVENPDAESNLSEKLLKQRRVQFYKRRGAEVFKKIFFQPPIAGFSALPMRLMYYATKPVDLQLEIEITKAVYFEKYHAVNRIQIEILSELLTQCGN
ncbi:MAG TPA: hypothetical protein VHM20_02755 [Gammaproteobacteria bacterium]|nr:hypothetical protein [Gammaproteobacteria bacterium]